MKRFAPRAGRTSRAATSSALAICLAAGLATASWAAGEPDPADKKRTVDDSISATKADLSDTSAELVEAYDSLKSTRAKLPAARSKAKKAEEVETAAQSKYDDAAADLRVAKADEAKARKDIRTTSTKITRARSDVAGFAGEVYQQQGLGDLSVALGAESPGEVIDRMVIADSAGGAQSDSLDSLTTSRADLVTQQDRLEALKDKTQQARDDASTALSDAKVAKTEADEAEADLESLEADQTSQAKTLRTERAKEQGRLTGLRAESDRLGKILEERARKARVKAAKIKAAREAEQARQAEARRRAAAAPEPEAADPNPTPPATSSGVLAAPVNAPITSEFGLRFHPILSYWRLHAGRDYGGACGAPVRAAADGTIVSAGVAGGYGNQIAVDHGVKRGVLLSTTYNHLQAFARTSGTVKRGELIGYVGTTGTSTGCHLHFETYENGTPVDPRRWL